MKNDWDDPEDFEDYENELHWQVKLNGELLGNFDTKEDALWSILEDVDTATDNLFFDGVGLIGYNNEDELFDDLYEMSVIDFYEQLQIIMDNFDLDGDEYRLINLNNEEPEFGEL